jgi:hypothetical protein
MYDVENLSPRREAKESIVFLNVDNRQVKHLDSYHDRHLNTEIDLQWYDIMLVVFRSDYKHDSIIPLVASESAHSSKSHSG